VESLYSKSSIGQYYIVLDICAFSFDDLPEDLGSLFDGFTTRKVFWSNRRKTKFINGIIVLALIIDDLKIAR